jgi:hypothetical protein
MAFSWQSAAAHTAFTVLALAAAGAAQATTSASAHLTLTGFRLVDLDLNDGIDASVTFNNVATFSASSTGSNNSYVYKNYVELMGVGTNNGSYDHTTYYAFDPVSEQGALGGVSGTASAGRSAKGLVTVSLTGATSGYDATGLPVGTGGDPFGSAMFGVMALSRQGFTLGANTSMVLTFEGGADAVRDERDTLTLFMSGWARVGDSLGSFTLEAPGSFTRKLAVFNLDTVAQEGELNVSVQAQGASYSPSPVPEAGTGLLALAGAAVAGAAVRRRRWS